MEFQPSQDDLNQLREWIAKTPHVLDDYDDEFLSAFVRSCKGSLQKTKCVLENFSGLGLKSFEMFGNLDVFDQTTREYLSLTRSFPLPKLTKDGSIVYMEAADSGFTPDVSRINPLLAFSLWLMMIHIYIWEKKYESGKWIFIFDCKHSHISNLSSFTPTALKQWLQAIQTAMPVRMQAVHLYNVPPFLEWTYSWVKSMAKKKMAERVHFHSSLESLYNSFPKELLPKDYGGNEASVAVLHEEWKKKLETYSTRLLEEQKKMRNLDPIRPKTGNDFEEMVGTFKKLDLD